MFTGQQRKRRARLIILTTWVKWRIWGLGAQKEVLGYHLSRHGDYWIVSNRASADHFNQAGKLIEAGKGAEREIEDYYFSPARS